VFQQAQ